MIPKFTKGPNRAKTILNSLVDFANKTGGSLGIGRVSSSRTAGGIISTVSMTQTRPRIAKSGQQIGSGIGIVRRAKTTAAAGAATTIGANLYDQNGVEQTSGDESGITVYCTVNDGGGNINVALTRLRDNQDIFVSLLPYSSTENRWYMIWAGLQPSEDCT